MLKWIGIAQSSVDFSGMQRTVNKVALMITMAIVFITVIALMLGSTSMRIRRKQSVILLILVFILVVLIIPVFFPMSRKYTVVPR